MLLFAVQWFLHPAMILQACLNQQKSGCPIHVEKMDLNPSFVQVVMLDATRVA